MTAQDLYLIFPSANNAALQHSALLTISSNVWHQRLAYSSNQVLQSLFSACALTCNKKDLSQICSASQHDEQIKDYFSPSETVIAAPLK